ncbi:tRNA-dihydrouridine synthase A [Pseudochelatococcus lubricantis]|uniref:tRNA-dihydrouridine(20/20a) synthase n=1 Tax=Pseudochelatococcus lubricantis TaxID=1538102 RepID=A0ABX0UTU8_9HYPH|nr:tRNA dihydrouridine(20/20a) synthase DusA [Pseudochelatococcus lubricantis]NIJ56387.1 tRNA-dihydrouridine synthase A [Pseudochelatococcus lubricantis]
MFEPIAYKTRNISPFGGARYAVAPMLDWTDKHCRFFHRLLSRRVQLYTEMVTTGAILFGNKARFLDFSPAEHPIAVQLGGSDPGELAKAARICADWGYGEINLNVGCPSDRVQNGRFGACLMREPALVGDCVAAMRGAVSIPVTVKCRIGVDDQDTQEALDALAEAVVQAGVDGLVVHARKAWLSGLSPKENRDIPPLDYARVHRLKQDRPGLPVMLNGGLATLAAAEDAIRDCIERPLDGAMIGRAAYQNPEILLGVDALPPPGEAPAPAPVADGFEAIDAFMPYVAAQLQAGVRLNQMTRHLLGLFPGRRGARLFRRHLATEAVRHGAGLEVLRAAVALVSREPAGEADEGARQAALPQGAS